MLIYEGTKDNFMISVEQDTIAVEIENNIYERMHRHTAKNEFRAWENSLEYMYKVLNDQDIPSDAGVAIEYNIPQTSKRVDFLISGYDKKDDANVVLIELKQWDALEAVPGRDGLVQTYTGNALRQVVHPSYQAWSYAMLISDYNASVQEGMISIFPCAYLHNYRRHGQDPIDAEQYEIYLKDAPAFTRGEVTKLRDFIKKSIRFGDNKELIYKIDSGRIKPSKSLQDSIAKMLKGNREFIMLDEQKVVYEEILDEARLSAEDGNKRVVIVKGGPGTGKSVVAVNLLASPVKMQEMIIEKNRTSHNRARILAGYCWNWKKEGVNDPSVHDIKIGDFEISWNLKNTTTYAIDEDSVQEAGCIHTSQGLEFDYVGVIIGDDMRYENGRIVTDFTKRARTDQSLRGIKKLYKEDPDRAEKEADEIIKNTYRTLMTRGMKGCYVYCTNQRLSAYLKKCLGMQKARMKDDKGND